MTIITAADVREDSQEPRAEDQHRADALELERARTTVEPEPVLRADGGEVESHFPELHVGDHVSDREDDDATMVVVGRPDEPAAEYTFDSRGTTVADANPNYPADDDVVLCVFPQRMDVSIEAIAQYSYPRSRLRLETPVHERDEGVDS